MYFLLRKCLLAVVLGLAAMPEAAGKEKTNWIFVSKPELRLYVLTPTDSILYHCRIGCGLRRGQKEEEKDFRTPEGRFFISGIFNSTDWLHVTPDGREVAGCYGPYFFRLNTKPFYGIGIHGTNRPESIGTRCSEGCIRVNSDHVVVLRKYVFEGMPVVVSAEDELTPPFKFRHPGG